MFPRVRNLLARAGWPLMGLVAFASAKGSPGVTTTTLAMGALWPRPVIVAECDASGADIPLRMANAAGGVLDPDRGLLSLAAAGRKGLRSDLVLAHTQRVIGGLDVLVGPRIPEQAAGMTNFWPLLGAALDALPGWDVLADCGRIGSTTPQTSVLRAARLLVLVCTAEPSSVVHLRERLTALAGVLDPASPVGTPIAVVVVAEPKAREAVAQVRETLQRTEVPLRAVWHLAYDEKGAGFFKGRVTGRADKTPLVRSAGTATDEAAAVVAPFFVVPPEEENGPDAESGPTEEGVVWEGFSFTAQGKAGP
jgi:hypothetical protein